MEYTFTVANFEEEVLNSPLPVLVDFYADWCNPCKMMAPTVAKLAEAYEGKVKVGKINVDENMTIAQKYRVASIPNFVIFRDGQPGAGEMINFEKELKNFQPSLEVEEAEAAIYNHDLTDVTDIITEILRDVRQNGQQLGQ